MSEHEITHHAKQFFEESLALNQVFKALPEGTEIQVSLDGRVDGTLKYDGSATRFSPGSSIKADFGVQMSTEALRRLGAEPPSEITALSRELLRETLSGQVKWESHIPASALKDKGYLKSIKSLGPALQGEAFQVLMVWAGEATMKWENLKSKFLKN